MICRSCKFCGAELHDSDDFCPGCGRKIIKEPEKVICPKCGTELHKGAEFCHKCGTKVTDFINISDAVQEEQKDTVVKRPKKTAQKKQGFFKHILRTEDEYDDELDDEYDDELDDEYEDNEIDIENDEYEEEYEENGYEENGYEEDEYDEEEEDSNLISKLTVLIGIIILIVALLVGFMIWKNANTGSDSDTQSTEVASESDTSGTATEESSSEQGELTISSNVNIRSEASTDATILGVAKKGETYTYSEIIDSDWYHITTSDGQDGYIYKDYVKVDS